MARDEPHDALRDCHPSCRLTTIDRWIAEAGIARPGQDRRQHADIDWRKVSLKVGPAAQRQVHQVVRPRRFGAHRRDGCLERLLGGLVGELARGSFRDSFDLDERLSGGKVSDCRAEPPDGRLS